MNIAIRKPTPLILAIAILYTVVGLWTTFLFRYEFNPDAVSSLTIARQYADGNWSQAINTFWGPLLPWAIAPGMKLGVDGQILHRIVSLVFGAGTLLGFWRLTTSLHVRLMWRYISLAGAAVLILSWSVIVMSSDLAVLCLMVWYCERLISPNGPFRTVTAIECGLIGALLYFTKPFGFMFFLVTYTVVIGWYWWFSSPRPSKITAIRSLLVGIGVFAVLALPWVIALTWKIGELTYSQSGTTNMLHQSRGLYMLWPHYTDGLFAPPFVGAVSVWYDPALEYSGSWSPISSFDNFSYFVEHFSRMMVIGSSLIGYGLILLAVLLGWNILPQYRKGFMRYAATPVVIVCAIYYLMYCVVKADEDRYLWPVSMLLVPTGLSFIQRLRMMGSTSYRVANVISAVLLILVLLNPTAHSQLVPPKSDGIHFRGIGLVPEQVRRQERLGQIATLDSLPRNPANIASNGEWPQSMYLSYYLDASYFGMLNPHATVEENISALDRYQIEWFLLWGFNETPAYLEGFSLFSTELGGELRIFRRGG